MSNKNLSNRDAIKKLKELAESIDFAMLCTDLSSRPFHAVPMSTKRVDERGHIWFLSGQNSTHNQNIVRESQIELLYSDPGSMQFLSLFGTAAISRDRSILEDLYGSTDDSWFEGVDDPNLTAIEITPIAAYYWDVKGNKLVALLKMGWGGMTGQHPDVSVEGELSV